MSVLILLIFFSMMVAGGFLAAFLWAVKTGQYDDNYTPSVRILFDDVKVNNPGPEDPVTITQKRFKRKNTGVREDKNKKFKNIKTGFPLSRE